jgi:hypothetical protein
LLLLLFLFFSSIFSPFQALSYHHSQEPLLPELGPELLAVVAAELALLLTASR